MTVDFCVDEKTPNLLPFEQLQKSVRVEFNGVVKKLIEEAVRDIATVAVEQKTAELYMVDG